MLLEQCFRKINPSALCRMDGWGQGSRKMAWKYCSGSGRAIAMSSVLSGKWRGVRDGWLHAVQLEWVEIGNWSNIGPKQERGIKNDFSAFSHLWWSNSTCSLKILAPLYWTNKLASFLLCRLCPASQLYLYPPPVPMKGWKSSSFIIIALYKEVFWFYNGPWHFLLSLFLRIL